MKFNWINAFGAAFVILMLIPNIIYAVKNKGEKSSCTNRLMTAIEQIGRYACILLMWLPVLVQGWEFGFAGVLDMVIYIAGNGAFVIAYLIVFAVYMKHKSRALMYVLAIIPVCIFLLSGILLRHWLLVGFAILFAAGHICITYKDAQQIKNN